MVAKSAVFFTSMVYFVSCVNVISLTCFLDLSEFWKVSDRLTGCNGGFAAEAVGIRSRNLVAVFKYHGAMKW